MSPKDKAREITEKMCMEIGTYPNTLVLSFGKRCAVIAVDEVIANMYDTFLMKEDTRHTELLYWIEIKFEIEKL